jgi:pimeloyl-ACP methyl ester carboxylesterase
MTRKTDIERRAVLRTLATASGAALTSAVLSRQAGAASDAAKTQRAAAINKMKGRATIILAHGAWADGSSWSAVIRPLQSMGLEVIAAPLPLSTFNDDVAALDRAIARTEGPVILAAHAYAGAVISASASERVKSLVFIAALAPDEGETVGDVFYRLPAHPDTAKLAPDANGLIWMAEGDFGKAFAQHAAPTEAHLLYATQRPIDVACIKQPVPKPGWKTRPSWFLIAEEDRMINPQTQHFMANRMKAHISSRKVDHVPLVTSPDDVVEMIRQSVEALG